MKQIRNEAITEKVIDDGNSYFHWLQDKSGISGPLSSLLAETEFNSVDGLDDVLEKKAKEEIRRRYVDDIIEKENLNDKDAETLYKSIRGDCCLFEVIICLAYSINELFEDVDAYDGCSHFFGILMKNSGLDLYDEEDLDTIGKQVSEYWERCVKRILDRTYEYSGEKGGLFPLIGVDKETYSDRRKVSLWQQANDWVDQHTNEDGEWVD